MSTGLDVDYFRRLLLERRTQLEAFEQDTSHGAVELDQTRVGRLSRMDAMMGHEMSLDAERRRKAGLKRIAQALTRLNADDFGCCEECGEAIAQGRLEVDPATLFCIKCASAREKHRS